MQEENGTGSFKESLTTLADIHLVESQVLVVCVTGAPIHIRVLWGVEWMAWYFYNPLIWKVKAEFFSRDVVPPTVLV